MDSEEFTILWSHLVAKIFVCDSGIHIEFGLTQSEHIFDLSNNDLFSH